MAEIYWVETPAPGGIAVMPAPCGGEGLEDDVRDFVKQKVDVVVSLLEPDEAERYDLSHEGGTCEAAGIEFLSHPIPDHDVPGSNAATGKFVDGLVQRFRKGKRLAIHCLGGIGRSPTIAAATMVKLGIPVEEVLQRLSKARGFPVPETPEQLAWVLEFARRC